MKALLSAFDLLPAWAWALLCSAAIATAAVNAHRLQAEQLAHQTTKATHATAQAQAEADARELSEKNRAIEQELRNAQDAHAQEIAAHQADVQRARDRARAAAGRVQDAARDAAERARAQCANAATAELRETAGDAIGVLAYVLGRADERAGELASVAEERGIAGRACERRYDEARQAVNR